MDIIYEFQANIYIYYNNINKHNIYNNSPIITKINFS